MYKFHVLLAGCVDPGLKYLPGETTGARHSVDVARLQLDRHRRALHEGVGRDRLAFGVVHLRRDHAVSVAHLGGDVVLLERVSPPTTAQNLLVLVERGEEVGVEGDDSLLLVVVQLEGQLGGVFALELSDVVACPW